MSSRKTVVLIQAPAVGPIPDLALDLVLISGLVQILALVQALNWALVQIPVLK